MHDLNRLRDEVCRVGQSLFQRGLTSGSTGNISVRTPDGGWLGVGDGVADGVGDGAGLADGAGVGDAVGAGEGAGVGGGSRTSKSPAFVAWIR